MPSWLRCAAVLFAGCFNPHYVDVRCAPACPSGLVCNLASGFCELPGGAGDIDAPGPASDAPPAFCSVGGVVACYEFEGDVRDGSGNGLDAMATGVTFVPGGQVDRAMQVGSTSAVTVAASVLFDYVTAVTIEAWIKLSQLPGSSAESVLLDVDNEYSFWVNIDGTLTCELHGVGRVSTAATVTVNQWVHVACTYDGVTGGRVYIDGDLAAMRSGSGQLSIGSNAMSIAANYPSGQQLIGVIDQLRLLNVARSTSEICADAGKPGCVATP